MSTSRKHLFGLVILVGFTTFISPGFIRRGVIYCSDQTPMAESVCQQVNLVSANGEFYLRYLSAAIFTFLIGLLAILIARDNPKIGRITHVIASFFSLVISFALIQNTPLVMITIGDAIKYVRHTQSAQLVLISMITPIVGLVVGYLFGWWVRHEHADQRLSTNRSRPIREIQGRRNDIRKYNSP